MMSRVCEISAAPHLADAVQPLPDGSHVDGRAFHTIVLLLCTGALAAAFLLRIDGDGLSLFGYPWLMHCRLYETFGVKCALCGMSRSFSSLAHGDIGASLSFHILGPAVFVFFCAEVLYRGYLLSSPPKATSAGPARAHFCAVLLVAAAVLANWLLYLGGLLS